MADSSHSISGLLEGLRQSDPVAARLLWERFYPRMVTVARKQLGTRPRRVADEEDAALGAFVDFEQAIKAGRFADLRDREGLWALLLSFTARKVQEQVRYESRERRGGGEVRGDSALAGDAGAVGAGEEEVMFQDSLEGLLAELESEAVRAVAVDRLAGWTNDEIARRQGCSRATVERRVRLVRETWWWLLGEADEKA